MSCNLSDEELWSGLDSGAREIDEHLAACQECRARAAEFRAGIQALIRASTPNDWPLPAKIGSYQIHRRLGEGGMGLVYEGEQESPARRVAIKVVRGGQCGDEYLVRLFQREVQALGRLKHSAIASIFEAGRTDDGQHFFVMELVPGVPLTEYLQADGIPLRRRLELFRRICEAIHYAHQRGVIHRDLKPTNILVDSEGSPKVLDFGLARITDPGADPTGTVTAVGRIGTPAYMSPEEARGRRDEIDVRTDVYSLGVIFYELLTGELPYTVNKTDWNEAVRVICEESPRRPASHDRALRGDLETIVLKALEKEPARRYQSVDLMAEDIERHLTDQPILGRRPSVLYRARKLLVRHKVRFMLLAALVLVLGARFWLHHWSEQVRISGDLAAEQGDIRVAVINQDHADLLLAVGNYVKAEGYYREALNTYDRLERYEPRRAGETLLGLASALVWRLAPTRADCDEAEGLLLDAVGIFEDGGPQWHLKLREARLRLQDTYVLQRKHLEEDRKELEGDRAEYAADNEDPEHLAEIDVEMEEIDVQIEDIKEQLARLAREVEEGL